MPDAQSMPVVRSERPRRKGNRKLLLLLFIFFAALLGVLFFQSSFSKIHHIEIDGHQLLTAEQVLEAAGIAAGDHFFAVSGEEISSRVTQLDAVESVRTEKKFPGTVKITVAEYPVVALELLEQGGIAGLLSNGMAIPYGAAEDSASRPILTGWEDEKLKTALCAELAKIPQEALTDVSEIRPSPTDSYADRIILYTRSQFEVVTTVSYLAEKINVLDKYVYEMKREHSPTGRIVLLETDYGETFDLPADDESRQGATSS